MLLPGNDANIRAYDTTVSAQDDYYTGHANLQKLNFDPLITGFAFIRWIHLPTWVTDEYKNFATMTQKNFKAFSGISDMTLQTQSYMNSFNGNEYLVNGTIQKENNTFSITHQEFSGSPMKNMYAYWISGISDPRTGIATYARTANMEYGAKNHTGELMYIVTRPDANNVDNKHHIEFAAYYTNVMPLTIPLSHFEFTEGSHDIPEVQINFAGTMNLSPAVDNMANEILKDTYTFQTEDDFVPIRTKADTNVSSSGDTLATYEPGQNGTAGDTSSLTKS